MEMIVAAALFAGSFLIIIGAFPLAARAIRNAEIRNVAHHLAQARLERLNVTGFDQLTFANTENVNVDLIHQGQTETTDFKITHQATDIGVGLRHVRVLVEWTRDGRNQNTFLETDIARVTP